MRRFTLTDDHLKLLRRANISWDDCEFGAPGLDPKRPFGNSDVLGDIHEIIGVPADNRYDDGEWPAGVEERYTSVYSELAIALEIVLRTGTFEVGVYEADVYRRNWRSVN